VSVTPETGSTRWSYH